MQLVPDPTTFQQRLTGLPIMKCQAGQDVMADGSADRRLLVLMNGSVEVLKDGVQIAKVSAPGAVFGELAVLLAQPHTADVRTLEPSEFRVADARSLLAKDSLVTLFVASILARRLDAANRAVVELKHQLDAGASRDRISKTVAEVQELLSSSGTSLVYAGYPYDPYAQDGPSDDLRGERRAPLWVASSSTANASSAAPGVEHHHRSLG